jgi:hypothetical protein
MNSVDTIGWILFSTAFMVCIVYSLIYVLTGHKVDRKEDWIKEQKRRRKSAGLDPVDYGDDTKWP